MEQGTQQVMNLTDIQAEESKPGHQRGRMETSTVSADSLCPSSAVNVF